MNRFEVTGPGLEGKTLGSHGAAVAFAATAAHAARAERAFYVRDAGGNVTHRVEYRDGVTYVSPVQAKEDA